MALRNRPVVAADGPPRPILRYGRGTVSATTRQDGSTAGAPTSAPSGARPAMGNRRPGRPFFPEFEGLRAVAALLVVMVHTSFASGFTLRSPLGTYTARGDSGVSVFFLISGFLLYRPFVAAHFEGRPGPDVRTFLVRRVLRIVPLYWAVLTVVYTVNGWSTAGGIEGVARTYLFAQVYSIPWVLTGIDQAWSLDIEVVFYLLLPLYAAVLGRRARGDRSAAGQLRVELVGLAALYLGGFAFHAYVLLKPSRVTVAWHGWLPTWVDMFALGMLLAVASAWYAHRATTPRWSLLPGADVACWVAAGAVYVVLSTSVGLRVDPLFVGSGRTELASHALSGLFAFLLLLPAVFGHQRGGPVRRLLTWRPVAAIGLVSYGVYLWHQLVVQQLLKHGFQEFHAPYLPFLAAALAVTLGLSTLTYLFVERVGVGVGHRWVRRRRERLVAPEAAAAHNPG